MRDIGADKGKQQPPRSHRRPVERKERPLRSVAIHSRCQAMLAGLPSPRRLGLPPVKILFIFA